MKRERILILGGTHEAARLAGKLTALGHEVITSLAGRTREPEPIAGEMRVGGFGGAYGLTHYLLDNHITRVVDATHPFASQITQNVRRAATLADIELTTETRPEWQARKGDLWIKVHSLEEAVRTLPEGAKVFLALGSQHLAAFEARKDVRYIVRMVDQPAEPLPFANYELITGKPGKSAGDEKQLLKQHGITHLVCRNSGGARAYAKIEAARKLKLPVIMIQRPS